MKINTEKLSRVEKNILTCIGHAILDYNSVDYEGRDYEETYAMLHSIRIHNLKYKRHWVRKDEIVINLERPGLFIGRKGELIEKIEEKIGGLLGRIVSIRLVESEIDSYLFPVHPSDFENN